MAGSPSLRIAAELRRRIHSGELAAGQLVPSTRRISREWGVAIATATRALAILHQDGLVESVRGVGTRVAGRTDRRTPPPPTPDLTRDRIFARAIAIADADGLEAVSMRRIAADLGVATMSLYRHVAGKEELILAMADVVIAELPLPEEPPAGWRQQLELVARLQWRGYQRHPWLPHVISMTRPQLIPRAIPHTELAIQALVGLGLETETAMQAAVTLFAFVRGIAVNLRDEAEAEQETGMTADEWVASQSEAFAGFMEAGPFPLMSQITRGPDLQLDLDTLFEFGLARLLDGYAQLR